MVAASGSSRPWVRARPSKWSCRPALSFASGCLEQAHTCLAIARCSACASFEVYSSTKFESAWSGFVGLLSTRHVNEMNFGFGSLNETADAVAFGNDAISVEARDGHG